MGGEFIFLEKLEQIKKNKKLACIYTNEDNTNKFMFGYIISFNENYFITASISPEGLYDGFVLLKTNKIFKIEIDNKYSNKMLTLINYHKTVHEVLDFNENLIEKLISYAQNKKFVVSIELLDSGYYNAEGYINTVQNEGCEIRGLTEYGEDDGLTFINFSDITKIDCNCIEQMALKILIIIIH